MIIFIYTGDFGMIEDPDPLLNWREKSIDQLLTLANERAPLYCRCSGIYTVDPATGLKEWLF